MAIDKAVDSTQLDAKFTAIAGAIRAKTGESGSMTPAQMPGKIAGIQTKETVTWHQCPEAVRNYLNQVVYTPSDYATSQIETYLINVPGDSKPVGKTVDGVTYYNQVPNVAVPFSSTNTAGTLRPLDRLRWIKGGAAGTNIRDLGGWQCDGGTVKYGKLFRGGGVYIGDQETIRVLHDEISIRAELDLQGTDAEADYSLIGSDVDFCCPKSDGNYWAYYTLTFKTSMREAFRFIFDSVQKNRPLYFHCSAGADRTATIACMIEALLGVPQNLIDMDYELTSFSGTAALRKRNSVQWEQLITRINALTVGSTFHEKMINYIASLGFTAEEINSFRAAMIDGSPSTVTPSIASYTIAKSGGHVTFDNTATTAAQYQPYECGIEPDSGYVIDSVTITMNGVDVTDNVFAGERVPFGVQQITENGEADVSWKSKVSVNVPQGITPAGTLNITENGTYDVTSKASAVVNVPASEARLPSAYQEVEWIASDGTQTMIVEFTTSNYFNVIMDAQFNSSAMRCLVGLSSTGGCYFGKGTNNLAEMGGGVTANVDMTVRQKMGFYRTADNVGHTVFTGASMQRNGSLAGTFWYIFGISGYMGSGVKVYSCKLFAEGKFIADLVPCYRKSDGVIGMYDIENNRFIEKYGSGNNFTKGADV